MLGPFQAWAPEPSAKRCWEHQARFQLASQLISPSLGSQSLPPWSCVPTPGLQRGEMHTKPLSFVCPQFDGPQEFAGRPELQFSLAIL